MTIPSGTQRLHDIVVVRGRATLHREAEYSKQAKGYRERGNSSS
jgi:hypothetical protein